MLSPNWIAVSNQRWKQCKVWRGVIRTNQYFQKKSHQQRAGLERQGLGRTENIKSESLEKETSSEFRKYDMDW